MARNDAYMRRAAGTILAALLLYFMATGAQACSTCGCTLNTDLGNQGTQGGTGWRLDLRYDLVDQTQLREGSSPVSVSTPEPYEVEQRTRNAYYDLGLDYGLNRSWGINLLVPYTGRYHSTYDAGDTQLSTSDYGHYLSDLRVVGRYTGFSPDMSSGFLFGLKLPTGSTNVKFRSGPDQGMLVDPTLQPGTGTTDELMGGYHFDDFGPMTGWFTQVMYQHALNRYNGYAAGNSLNLNVGLRLYWSDAVIPQLQLNYQVRARDTGPHADSSNTGGQVVYLSPGLTFSLESGWHGFLFVQVPVHQYVNGLQLTPRRIYSIGMSRSF